MRWYALVLMILLSATIALAVSACSEITSSYKGSASLAPVLDSTQTRGCNVENATERGVKCATPFPDGNGNIVRFPKHNTDETEPINSDTLFLGKYYSLWAFWRNAWRGQNGACWHDPDDIFEEYKCVYSDIKNFLVGHYTYAEKAAIGASFRPSDIGEEGEWLLIFIAASRDTVIADTLEAVVVSESDAQN